MSAPVVDTVDVIGGESFAFLRWDGGSADVAAVGIHGLTANAWSWAPVARHLGASMPFAAVDLRGRGANANTRGLFGIENHAADVAKVARSLDSARVVVAGHSMGASVALACANLLGDVTAGVVLVDGFPGGSSGPAEPNVDPIERLHRIVGPALDRLEVAWPDPAAYRAMWEKHPAFMGRITDDIERYLMEDLVFVDGQFRSKVNSNAIRTDAADLMNREKLRGMLDECSAPIFVVRAEYDASGGSPPLVSADLVTEFPSVEWTSVPGTNHYDVLVGEIGAEITAETILKAAKLSSQKRGEGSGNN